ncbi:MAG: 16S rRNA (adenine(1518)-N(6)/adenine(1519)-N(6))-dimethyltransferase RsmA [Candidatus Shikimatogenerans bostrichidophilus]|nr:MAG: 16S rRNA (adenine(1518)-N(6)/adenine(1519)-N(6))-dimethyltransferase RsmA [Candidatus Shikimatogenerans bostrichidophilus]
MIFFKKKYSQHILINKEIILKIINFLKKRSNKIKYDYILEIGAGSGNLSKKLIKLKKKCILVEIDKSLINKLKKINYKQEIINENILNIELKKIKKNKKFYIIGNFPYNISSKLLLWFIKNKNYIAEIIGTFQKEFINNIIINNNNKKLKIYKSKLSIYFNMFFYVKKIFDIPKNYFYPIPKVDSTVVIIKKKNKKYKINIKQFLKIIKEAFSYKRKILKNSLKKKFKIEHKVLKSNLLFNKRAEELSLKDYIYIYKLLKYGKK